MAATKDWKKVKSAVAINAALGKTRVATISAFIIFISEAAFAIAGF